MKKLIITLIAICVAIFVSACSPGGFVKQDIDKMKEDIAAEFQKKGVQVKEVEMIIESPKKATGFYKGEIYGVEIFKKCSAVYGEESRIIWSCE